MTSASPPDWESQGVHGSVLIEKPFAPARLQGVRRGMPEGLDLTLAVQVPKAAEGTEA